MWAEVERPRNLTDIGYLPPTRPRNSHPLQPVSPPPTRPRNLAHSGYLPPSIHEWEVKAGRAVILELVGREADWGPQCQTRARWPWGSPVTQGGGRKWRWVGEGRKCQRRIG